MEIHVGMDEKKTFLQFLKSCVTGWFVLRKFLPSPLIRISWGLVSVVLSAMLIGDAFLHPIPDKRVQLFELRRSLAQSLALQYSALATQEAFDSLQLAMEMLVKQEKEMVYVHLASLSEDYALTAGTPPPGMITPEDAFSTIDFLQVPIFWGEVEWGVLQLQFQPSEPTIIEGVLGNPGVRFAMFIACVSFLGFYLILRRTLRHLDPSNVVPTRVKTALDGLEEGVVLLDTEGNIVLANNAFAKNVGGEPATLLGKPLSQFPWRGADPDNPQQSCPWTQTQATSQAQTDVPLLFTDPKGHQRKLIVNSTPILDDKESARGVLVAFNDVTELDQANEYLMSVLGELHEAKAEVTKQNETLHRLATRDPLTDCLNRRAFFEQLAQTFISAQQEGHNLSCIMLDIDHFKLFNDRYGHAVGDQVICVVVATLMDNLRSEDFVGRYGGEEFCVIFPGVSGIQCAMMAERVRQAIETESGGKIRMTSRIRITASFGVSSLSSGASDLLELIDQADKALYSAKETGRNKVIHWESLKTPYVSSLQKPEPETLPPLPALSHSSELP